MATPIQSSRKVFISYSWDDPAHKSWVKQLADRLRSEHGVDIILDQYDLAIGENLAYFMTHSLETADKVLIVLTPIYKQKALSAMGGVGFEHAIINQGLYNVQAQNKKFLPILRRGNLQNSAPGYIETLVYFDMSADDSYESTLFELGRLINDQLKNLKPPLGRIPNYDADKLADPNSIRISQIRKDYETKDRQSRFLNSVKGFNAANQDRLKLYLSIQEKAINYTNESKILFNTEVEGENLVVWINEGSAVYLLWNPRNATEASNVYLVIKYYARGSSGKRGGSIDDMWVKRHEYAFVISADLQTYQWRRMDDRSKIQSRMQLEYEIFGWLLSQIEVYR